jgi:hypothetical protein
MGRTSQLYHGENKLITSWGEQVNYIMGRTSQLYHGENKSIISWGEQVTIAEMISAFYHINMLGWIYKFYSL